MLDRRNGAVAHAGPVTTYHVRTLLTSETLARNGSVPRSAIVKGTSDKFDTSPLTAMCPVVPNRYHTRTKYSSEYLQRPDKSHTAQPSQPSTSRNSLASATELSCNCIPTRNSSLVSAANRQQHQSRCKTRRRRSTHQAISLHNNRCKQFDSIDKMLNYPSLSSTSASDLPLMRQSPHLSFESSPPSQRPSIDTPSFQSSPDASPRPKSHRRGSSIPASYIHVHVVTPPVPTHEQDLGVSSSNSIYDRPIRPSLGPQTLTWTSHESRTREYASIDRAHSGFRGFLRRILPGGCFRDGYRKFYRADGTEQSEDDDARSVRRYRLDEPIEDAKSAAIVQMRERHGMPVVGGGILRFRR
jgi:hypothetical protein